MHTTSFTILAMSSIALAKTIDIDVGKGGLVFAPDNVMASTGDTLNFHFYPGDHSVAQSTFQNPCVPSGSNALFSGYFNPSSGEDNMMFSVMVNSSDPMWLYCSQASHCEEGMVMVVNAPGDSDMTLDAYSRAASKVSMSSAPSNVEGGVVKANVNAMSTSMETDKGSTATVMTSTSMSGSSSMMSSMMSSTASSMMSSSGSMIAGSSSSATASATGNVGAAGVVQQGQGAIAGLVGGVMALMAL